MSRYAWPAVWLVLAWVGLPVGAAHAFLDLHRVTGQPVDTHYRVMDSGLHTTEDENIYWIDNRQVIFWGFRLTDDGGLLDGPHDRGIYIWDTETGKIRWYADGDSLCYANGYINYGFLAYPRKPPDIKYRVNWKEGPMGRERLHVVDLKDDAASMRWYRSYQLNPFDCHMEKWPKGMSRSHRRWTFLLPADGYLDEGPYSGGDDSPVTWHRPNGEVIPLPLKRKDVMSVQYYPFKKAYFFWRDLYVQDARRRPIWKRDGCSPGTWFYPDGKVERFCIPFISWIPDGSVDVYESRPGLLFRTDSFGRHGYAGTSGLYLIAGGETHRLLAGQVTGVGISPDGCRVAMVHAPDIRVTRKIYPVTSRIKAIELCTPKGKQITRDLGPARFVGLGVPLNKTHHEGDKGIIRTSGK